MKVGYDVFELSVSAELSPGTDFDPKQLESLKRRCCRRIQHMHTHTYVHSHINAYGHTTKAGCSFRVAAGRREKGIDWRRDRVHTADQRVAVMHPKVICQLPVNLKKKRKSCNGSQTSLSKAFPASSFIDRHRFSPYCCPYFGQNMYATLHKNWIFISGPVIQTIVNRFA